MQVLLARQPCAGSRFAQPHMLRSAFAVRNCSVRLELCLVSDPAFRLFERSNVHLCLSMVTNVKRTVTPHLASCSHSESVVEFLVLWKYLLTNQDSFKRRTERMT